MLFFAQFIVGAILIIVGVTFWWASKHKPLRTWLESAFFGEGDGLFDKGKPYTYWVIWCRYVSFFAGLAMIVPTIWIWDVVIGAVAAIIFFLLSIVKTKHDEIHSGKEAAKPNEA